MHGHEQRPFDAYLPRASVAVRVGGLHDAQVFVRRWTRRILVGVGLPAVAIAGLAPLIGPAASGSFVLTSNSTPPLVVGQRYYLLVTNSNPVATTFAIGTWFDITTLTKLK